VHEAFAELLLLPDFSAVDVALAGVVANYADGDPVWPLLVGPPGGGKSEIVSALSDVPDVWPLSSLTPQTLISGAEDREGKSASLLLQIGPFGIIAFKDLTTVLTMHRDARQAIIGQLREVADGRCDKSFGTGARVTWQGKLGLVAGVTPVIDEQHAFLAIMASASCSSVCRRFPAERSLGARSSGEAKRKIFAGASGRPLPAPHWLPGLRSAGASGVLHGAAHSPRGRCDTGAVGRRSRRLVARPSVPA
jgi:hypothetical protein